MTVCIAAICTFAPNMPIIVGASDRMVSAPDLKFEPPQRKIYSFYPWVVALVAGDPYVQISICDEASRVFKLRPKAPTTVEEVARTYAEAFTLYRRRFAENKYLKPLGLDVDSFLDRQMDFQNGFVSGLRHDLQNSPLEVETIIAGMDATGAHIFIVTDPGDIACADGLGFASIGTGKFHADWQFMMARYTRNEPVHRALLLTYLAKKRAEVSPTVGEMTDLFFIGMEGFTPIANEVHGQLDKISYRFNSRNHESMLQAESEAKKYHDEIMAAPPPPDAKPEPSGAAPSPPTAGKEKTAKKRKK